MILNMNQLRSFYMAAKMGSISKAATELMVTPPAITMQVKQLEEAVGIRLVLRDGNSMRLTPTGELLLQKAEKVFLEARQIEEFLTDISKVRSGELRLGCPEVSARYLMPKFTEFKDLYPGVRIVLSQGTHAEMVKSVLDHRNELAVILDRASKGKLKIKLIGKLELVLVASPVSVHLPGSEISVARLADIPMILRTEGSAVREIVLEYLNKFSVLPMTSIECTRVSSIKEFVMRDGGVAFVEKDAVEAEIGNGSLKTVSVLEGSPAVGLGFGYRSRRDLSPTAKAFLGLFDNLEVV